VGDYTRSDEVCSLAMTNQDGRSERRKTRSFATNRVGGDSRIYIYFRLRVDLTFLDAFVVVLAPLGSLFAWCLLFPSENL
jgi:hypothetical protein